MPKAMHDKGIARLIGLREVKKGDWYYGFICKNCGQQIHSLIAQKPPRDHQPVAGLGKFSVPCRSCGTDKILYETSDLIALQADRDVRSEAAYPRRKSSNRPRQPISTRYPEVAPTFGPMFLEQRPECAIIIARAISTWSYIEVQFALLLAALLKTNTAPAVAMFLAIQNGRTQRDVLNAVANTVLNKPDYELYGAIMNLSGAIEGARNDLVHGLYGMSHLVKDGILWQAQRHSTSYTAKIWGSDFKEFDEEHLKRTTFVYEPSDLEAIAESLEWLQEFIGSFRGYVTSENAQWRVERYHQLCAEPRVQQELIRMRGDQQKRPPLLPKKSRKGEKPKG